jgi:murein DD-endopeptidase MepM/ murein hydrolase activator NlpD
MKKFLILLLSLTIFLGNFILSSAEETATEIEKKIKTQDKEIEKLEKEIRESEKKVEQYSGESTSLKKEIANLNYLNSKLKKTIYQKEKDIEKISDKITKISDKININNNKINDLKNKLKNNIFAINQISSTSVFEKILAGKQLSDATDDIVKIETIQKIFQNNIKDFIKIFDELDQEKKIQETENNKLDIEKEKLSDKKFLLEKNKKDKNYILKITKNKEENFKTILAQQKKEKEEFEKELFELESKLQFILDKDSIPKKQVGLFDWPTPKKSSRISQFFGYTDFHNNYSTQKRHNGIDIAVQTGTIVSSVMSGKILDTGDATKICRGKQYGK